MKKMLYIAALLLGVSLGPGTQAQVLFDSDSARPIHPDAALRAAQAQPKTAKSRRVLVNCRDGTRHIARVCRRHGGIARDQSGAQK